MVRSNRGAARVSVVWMISVLVVMLAALAFGFISQSDLAAAEKNTEAAQAARTEAVSTADELREVKRNISEVTGWYDRASADPTTDTAAASAAIEDLRSTFTDLTSADKDFETVLPKIVAAYNARGTEISTLETRISSLESELAAARSSVQTVTSTKDQTIDSLRGELADEQQKSQTRQSELEDRVAGVQDQLSDRDSELRSLRGEIAEKERAWANEKTVLEGIVANLRDTTRFAREEFANEPDGRIIEVSSKLPIAWVDIGANERLTKGMRFRIEGGKYGDRHLKAWGEVSRVERSRAEIVLSGLADRFDPVVVGDVIINPVYDPVGGRNAVLAGSFSGTYSRKELTTLLGNLGINVQDSIDETTHFLIVGSTLYNDPVDNTPLDEPISPKDLPEYKEAEVRHIQIIPLSDIRSFFKVER